MGGGVKGNGDSEGGHGATTIGAIGVIGVIGCAGSFSLNSLNSLNSLILHFEKNFAFCILHFAFFIVPLPKV